MTLSTLRSLGLWILPVVAFCAPDALRAESEQDAASKEPPVEVEKAVQVDYLEIVTPDVEETCETLAAMHGVKFSKPVPEFGNARTAPLRGGGLLGVRRPLRETEEPVVRPYLLVDDLDATVEKARAAGAEIAIPRMEIPERGAIAIYIHGGIEHGVWQK